jgi:hypothetical protein
MCEDRTKTNLGEKEASEEQSQTFYQKLEGARRSIGVVELSAPSPAARRAHKVPIACIRPKPQEREKEKQDQCLRKSRHSPDAVVLW